MDKDFKFCRVFELENRQILAEIEDLPNGIHVCISTKRLHRVYTHIPFTTYFHAANFLETLDEDSALEYLDLPVPERELEICPFCGAFKVIGKSCSNCD